MVSTCPACKHLVVSLEIAGEVSSARRADRSLSANARALRRVVVPCLWPRRVYRPACALAPAEA